MEPRLHEEILRQRLDGAAGLADGHDDGFLGIEGRHLRFEHVRIDVVQNPQPRPGMVGAILLREKGFLERARAEGRTADAEHDHVPETLELRGERLEAGRQAGPEGKVEEGKFARRDFADEARVAAVELRREPLERLRARGGRIEQASGPGMVPVQRMHTVSSKMRRPAAAFPPFREGPERGGRYSLSIRTLRMRASASMSTSSATA